MYTGRTSLVEINILMRPKRWFTLVVYATWRCEFPHSGPKMSGENSLNRYEHGVRLCVFVS